MGEHSFGKGTVQTSFDKQFGDGSLLKVTIAKWLTPNGTWIHEKGIEPDIKVLQPEYFSVAPIDKKKTYAYDSGKVLNIFSVRLPCDTSDRMSRCLPVLFRKRKLMAPSANVASCPLGM